MSMRRSSVLRRPLPYREFNAVHILIGTNVIVYFFTFLAPGLVPLLAMNPLEVVDSGMVWQPFTYMFVHSTAGLGHILFNMFGLFIFGMQVERRLGSSEFLLFYLLSGLLAGIASLGVYWVTGEYYIQLLGASGAVFAVLLAFATLFPRSTIFLFGIVPIPAPVLVVGYAVLELFSSVYGRGTGVAHLTHLAGFVIAYLYFVVRLRISPIRAFLSR